MPGRALAVLDEVTAAAYKRQNLARPVAPVEQHRPLLPLLVEIAQENAEPHCEHILWRLGDPRWQPAAVAAQLCFELQLPLSVEQSVVQQLEQGLAGYSQWKDPGAEHRVLLQVFARHGDLVMRDSVEWDVSQPPGGAAAQYAASVCGDLGLGGVAWLDAITAHVERLVADAREDARQFPGMAPSLPPLSCGRHPPAEALAAGGEDAAAPAGGPRIEAYDASADLEDQRRRHRSSRRDAAEIVARERRETDVRRREEERVAGESALALRRLDEERRRAADEAARRHREAEAARSAAAAATVRDHAASRAAAQAEVLAAGHAASADNAAAAFDADWQEGLNR